MCFLGFLLKLIRFDMEFYDCSFFVDINWSELLKMNKIIGERLSMFLNHLGAIIFM